MSKKVEETLQQLIEFSEQQLLQEQRKLEAQGKSSNNVVLAAYKTVIANLTGVLGPKRRAKPTKGSSESTTPAKKQEESDE